MDLILKSITLSSITSISNIHIKTDTGSTEVIDSIYLKSTDGISKLWDSE